MEDLNISKSIATVTTLFSGSDPSIDDLKADTRLPVLPTTAHEEVSPLVVMTMHPLLSGFFCA